MRRTRTGDGMAVLLGNGDAGAQARPDLVIDSLAAAQHGLVTRLQLLRAGISRHLLDHRIAAGRFRRVHAGVYQVGPLASPRAREMAAVLACGNVAVSEWSAGALWEIGPPQIAAQPVDVTGTATQRVRRPGIRAHRCRSGAEEVTRLDGIPITTPAMTLLDLSRTASPRELERALAGADRAGIASGAQVLALLTRFPGRAASRRLRDLVGSDVPPAFTRSEAEERVLLLIRAGGLPRPEFNVVVQGFEVDCYWPAARLVLEVDGYAFHGSSRAFVRDRQRDMALAAAGIQVLRLTWQQITTDRDRTLVQLAQALARSTALRR